MSRTLLVAGTASHVGKSTVAAGLCRLLADRGVDVAPFKAQNMSNNARAVPRPGDDGPAYGEIGVSQYVQARAARCPPSTDNNPVLLKPRGGGESQLVIDGRAVGHFAAGDYFEEHWERARSAAVAAHGRLAAAHDVVVAEGAGSIAEINLHDRDLANVETARFGDRVASETRRDGRAAEPRGVEILLVVDVERGGAFAALVGTLELMPEDLRDRVVGAVLTKFRGDPSILQPGIEAVEARTGVPVLGVLPHDEPGLPAEDIVSLPAADERAVWRGSGGREGTEGVPGATGDGDPGAHVTVTVPRFPRVSNATDVEPLADEPGVAVEWLPLDGSLADADAVVLPGTKNAVDDLLAAREAGLHETLRAFDGPVVGLCGGYQLLGERLTSVGPEATDATGTVEGIGLLPVETAFSMDKTVAAVERELRGVGPLAGASGTVRGYEIHAGETRLLADVERPFPDDGAASGPVVGTYLHGLFENRIALEAFLDSVFAHAGRERPAPVATDAAASSYDRAAALLADHADLDPVLTR